MWCRVDLEDAKGIADATRGADAIIHLAAVSSVNAAYNDPLGCVRANITGTANVLEAARSNGIKRVIFASTVWVYQAAGDGEGTEDASLCPGKVKHIYTGSKIAGEMLCNSYWQLYGVPFTILRFGIPYGPGMRDELVIARFIRRAMAGEPITIQGNGEQYRSFVFVKDLAEGVVLSLADRAQNQVYNLEGAEQISILDIARTLGKVLGGVKVEFQPARPGDFRGAPVSAEKALMDLYWRPRTSFVDGLRRTVAWYASLQEAVPSAAG